MHERPWSQLQLQRFWSRLQFLATRRGARAKQTRVGKLEGHEGAAMGDIRTSSIAQTGIRQTGTWSKIHRTIIRHVCSVRGVPIWPVMGISLSRRNSTASNCRCLVHPAAEAHQQLGIVATNGGHTTVELSGIRLWLSWLSPNKHQGSERRLHSDCYGVANTTLPPQHRRVGETRGGDILGRITGAQTVIGWGAKWTG